MGSDGLTTLLITTLGEKMAGKYNWRSFQTLMLKYFKRKDFYIKEETKTIRFITWTRGNSDIIAKYSHSGNSERLLSIKILRWNEHGFETTYNVDLKTYSFGFDEIEKSPYIKWEINNGTGFRQLNFPQS